MSRTKRPFTEDSTLAVLGVAYFGCCVLAVAFTLLSIWSDGSTAIKWASTAVVAMILAWTFRKVVREMTEGEATR